jgi:GNAT superfamily N-acetyltransferase
MNFFFSVEKWKDLLRDGQDIFAIHYDDLSLEKNIVPLDVSDDNFQTMEDKNMLLVVTARLAARKKQNRKLVGYYIAIIFTHPHYKSAGLMSTTDAFYILPDFRVGGCGARLLMFAADALKERGVYKAFIGTKLKQDNTELLEALGWVATDKVFTKVLGE